MYWVWAGNERFRSTLEVDLTWRFSTLWSPRRVSQWRCFEFWWSWRNSWCLWLVEDSGLVSTGSGLNAIESRFVDHGVRGICEKSFCNSCSSMLVFEPTKRTTMTCLSCAQFIPLSNLYFDSCLFILCLCFLLCAHVVVIFASCCISANRFSGCGSFSH